MGTVRSNNIAFTCLHNPIINSPFALLPWPSWLPSKQTHWTFQQSPNHPQHTSQVHLKRSKEQFTTQLEPEMIWKRWKQDFKASLTPHLTSSEPNPPLNMLSILHLTSTDGRLNKKIDMNHASF